MHMLDKIRNMYTTNILFTLLAAKSSPMTRPSAQEHGVEYEELMLDVHVQHCTPNQQQWSGSDVLDWPQVQGALLSSFQPELLVHLEPFVFLNSINKPDL